jgi:hypothetical protein
MPLSEKAKQKIFNGFKGGLFKTRLSAENFISEILQMENTAQRGECPDCAGNGWYYSPRGTEMNPKQEQCERCGGTGYNLINTTPTTAQTPPIEGVSDEQLRMQAVNLAKLFPDSPGIYYCALECLVAVRDKMREGVGCSSCRANAIYAASMDGVVKRAEAALAEMAGREEKAEERGFAMAKLKTIPPGQTMSMVPDIVDKYPTYADYRESLKKKDG